MNEELLQLAYSKFETDADYETFKADLLENEDLQKLAYDKFETDADFDTFRGDLLGGSIEKKNPVQNEPSGESLSEDTELVSPDPQVEDGSSESPKEAQHLLPKGKEANGVGDDMWKSLKAGTAEALAGISGITGLTNKAFFSLFAPQEIEDELNKLSPEEREKMMNGFMDSVAPIALVTGKNWGFNQLASETQNKLNAEAEEIRGKMTQYDASITEDLGNLDFSQAGRRIAVEGVGTIPSILEAMIPVVGLGVIGAGTAANKQERLEAEGEDFGGKTVVNSILTGAVEGLLEKYTANQGSKLVKAVLGRGSAAAAPAVKGFLEGLKDVAKGMGMEGGTEALQTLGENLVDALTTGNEKKAMEIFTETVDSFLVGAAVGGVMRGGQVVATNVQAGISQKQERSNQTQFTENPVQDGDQGGNLNIPVVETVEELQKQLDYITNKEGMDAQVKADLMKEIGEKINKLEAEALGAPEAVPEAVPEATPAPVAGVAPNQLDDNEAVDEEVDTEEKINEVITKGRDAGKTDTEILEEIKNKNRKTTAEILLKREADENLTPEEAAAISKEAAETSRQEQRKADNSHLTEAEKAIGKATDMYVDRQGSVKAILRKSGMGKVTDYMVTKLGASAAANNTALDAHKRTFDKLKTNQIKDLEEIILLKNIISIDSERKRLGLPPVKHQANQTGVSAAKALEGYKSRMGTKEFTKLEKRAKEYFDVNKKLLTDMRSEGLITQDLYDKIIARDYQSRLFLDFMKDMDNNFLSEELDNFETSSLSAEQVKRMKRGFDGSQSMDSQTLQQKSILAKTKAIFANRLNVQLAKGLKENLAKIEVLEAKDNLTKKEATQLRNLKEIRSAVRMDKIIGWTPSGNAKYALAPANTKGYKPIYYYKNGVANRIFLKEDFYDKFTDTGNQILNASTREGLSKLSGSRIVKTLATGQNPLFFITNIPRDLAFALVFSQEYGSKGNSFVGYHGTKLAIDFAKGSAHSLTKGSLYQKYMEYGGGMDFLTIQGRYGKEGLWNKWMSHKIDEKLVDVKQTGVARGIKWLSDGIQRFNTASEFATRLAVFNRSIQNQLKKMGVKDIEALTKEKQDEVYTKAVRSARELTDFNQGGKYTKALDSAIPYLNAATQGTRAAAESFKNDPVGTVFKTLQVTAGFTAALITFAFNFIGVNKDDEDEVVAEMTDQEIYFETLKGVSEYDLRNYYIIPKGTRTESGEWNYFRVAKAQALSPFINTSEFFLRKYHSENHNIEYKQDLGKIVKETVNNNVLPLGFGYKETLGKIPSVNALVASLGIDVYTGNPLDWKRGEIPPELEGLNNDKVNQFYKDIGEMTDYSPVRMQKMIESYITTPSTNPYVGMAYMGADLISDPEKEDLLKSFVKTSMKRISKSTSEYNRIAKSVERASGEALDIYRKHLLMEYEVRQAVKKSRAENDPKVLEDVLNATYKKHPELAEQSIKWAKSEMEKKKLGGLVNSLKYTRNKEVRALIIAENFGNDMLKNQDQYGEEEKAIILELIKENVFDDETYNYYKNLVEDR